MESRTLRLVHTQATCLAEEHLLVVKRISSGLSHEAIGLAGSEGASAAACVALGCCVSATVPQRCWHPADMETLALDELIQQRMAAGARAAAEGLAPSSPAIGTLRAQHCSQSTALLLGPRRGLVADCGCCIL